MQFGFSYDKKKVIQALRYHFISRSEIKILMIVVNIFAVASAFLFWFKKIRPEPFFLGSTIWLLLMVSVWYILPYTVYRKASTFKDAFLITFYENNIHLENPKGYVDWEWNRFSHWMETPNFFHLYFDAKSFFLIPKDEISDDQRHELRGIFKQRIGKQK
jgi:YcxB-like protein